ncbi:MAG: LOG family protein [Planctomycetota bacterium]|jgi:uncharacterized protein (TIGR00730 family)
MNDEQVRVFRRLCVYCASNEGKDARYVAAAKGLGQMLASRDIGIVYGGGNCGLMGVVANASMSAGGEVIGVIPAMLQERELAHQGVTELHVVKTMHERKAMMAELADGFIALPGGFGTFEEIFESITWAQLGIHHHPVAMLNVGGYYDPVQALVDRAVDDGLIKPEFSAMVIIDDDMERMLWRMEEYERPDIERVMWGKKEIG